MFIERWSTHSTSSTPILDAPISCNATPTPTRPNQTLEISHYSFSHFPPPFFTSLFYFIFDMYPIPMRISSPFSMSQSITQAKPTTSSYISSHSSKTRPKHSCPSFSCPPPISSLLLKSIYFFLSLRASSCLDSHRGVWGTFLVLMASTLMLME